MSTFDQHIIEALRTLELAAQHAPVALASSLAAEDMVLTDLILTHALPIEIFTLDTGRLHPETLGMIEAVQARYHYAITVYRPHPEAVAGYVQQHGENAFYESIELRKACCHLRKVEPLERALLGRRAWITGQRRAQASTRAQLGLQEEDPAHQMLKFNPLANWDETEVWRYIKQHQVPYNPLHDQGYPSIGCAPCTRPVTPGEDIRAGRWWWEHPETKECGLHVVDGKLVRMKHSS